MIGLAKSVLIVGGLIAGVALAADAPRVNLNEIMTTKVNPQATAIWAITGAAQDDDGNIDLKKLDGAKMVALMTAAKSIQEGAALLAGAKEVVAASPGVKLQDEVTGGANAAQVQHSIDAKPAEWRKRMALLRDAGAGLVDALSRKDSKKLTQVSGALDQICQDCHMVFWYPQLATPK